MANVCMRAHEHKRMLIQFMHEHEEKMPTMEEATFEQLALLYLVNCELCKETMPGHDTEEWKEWNEKTYGAEYPETTTVKTSVL